MWWAIGFIAVNLTLFLLGAWVISGEEDEKDVGR